MIRRPTRAVKVGALTVGGQAPVVVQSMTNTDTGDSAATLAQISAMVNAGCEIVRVAVPNPSVMDSFAEICDSSSIPVVADIHFDNVLAIEAARRGASALRINPGNIGSVDRLDSIIEAAGEAGIPVRIGVNAGSLAARYHDLDWPLPNKLVASAIEFVEHFESRGFFDLAISAKASSVNATVAAYRLLAEQTDYPLHIGVTEAGTLRSGTVKSSVGIGILLAEGIGDTLRVSLTADPVEEVLVAWEILAALDIRRRGAELISCPTCGRCQVDLISIATEVERRLSNKPCNLKVAVMGCVVNGPGEASEADVGVAAGKGLGIVFSRGKPIAKVPEEHLVDALMSEIDRLNNSK